jgi:hypothetical protein
LYQNSYQKGSNLNSLSVIFILVIKSTPLRRFASRRKLIVHASGQLHKYVSIPDKLEKQPSNFRTKCGMKIFAKYLNEPAQSLYAGCHIGNTPKYSYEKYSVREHNTPTLALKMG